MNSPRTLPLLLTAAALAAPAAAQISLEGFDMGTNPDNWEAWFSTYNQVYATGGNPGGYLELDNVTSGPATCHFVNIAPEDDPGTFVHRHSGDWRAAGATGVRIDLDIQQGIYGGDLVLELTSDPGTPASPADDCIVRLRLPSAGASAPGWNTYVFPVPSAQTFLPSGWEIDGSCTGNAAWNQVMTDVDQILVRYDGNPPSFCTFTSWILRVDNIEVIPGTPPAIGTNYCSAVPNSTGQAASMSALGSTAVAQNNVTLHCDALPPNQFGLFVVSRIQGFVPGPGGSLGNLCLGGSLGRYNLVQNSGPTGEVSFPVDLTAIPQGSQSVATLPGDTWNFTYWYRDVVGGGAVSNFADGLSIDFQ